MSSWLKIPLLFYATILCSFLFPFQVVCSPRQMVEGEGSVTYGSRTCCSKRDATNTDEEYLLGIKRTRRLYCNIGIGFHIQVLPTGKITGVHHENSYSKYVHFDLSFELQLKKKKNRKDLQTEYYSILSVTKSTYRT